MIKLLIQLLIIFTPQLSKYWIALYISQICLFTLQLSAQQDPLLSQYMFNRIIINPGYAGSSNMLSGTLGYRQQFVGMEGAPKMQLLTIHAPIKAQSMGLGIKAIHENIGVTNQNSVTAIYTYQLRFAKGRLSLGLEGGIFSQSIDFTNLRKTVQDDNALPIGKESVLVPDAAFGVYYYSEKLYFGGAVYHLLQNKLNYSGYTGKDRELIAKLSSHAYLTGGYTLKAGENINVGPSLLLKYVFGAPAQMDLNINATFKEMFTIGGGYRTGDAIVFLFQYSFKDRIKFSYAYDYTISELAAYSSGSHGIMLSYNMPAKKKARDVETSEEMIAEISPIDTLPAGKDFSGEDSLPISVSPINEDAIVETEQEFIETPADTAVTGSTITETPDGSLEEVTSTFDPEIIAKDTLTIDGEILKDDVIDSKVEPTGDILIVGPAGIKNIVFRVQIHASREPIFLAPANFRGMENIEEYQEEELYKYVVGISYDYDYAKTVLLNQVKSKGFKDAFIVAFKKGEKIPIKEALNLLKQ